MELTLSSLALRAQTRARPRAEEVAAEKVAVMQEVKTKLSECGGLAQFVGCAAEGNFDPIELHRPGCAWVGKPGCRPWTRSYLGC